MKWEFNSDHCGDSALRSIRLVHRIGLLTGNSQITLIEMAEKRTVRNRVPTQFTRALRDKRLLRFNRSFEPGSIDGYLLDIGPRFILLLSVEDGIRFNGFQCFQLSDIHELQVPHPHAAFVEAALKKRREHRPQRPQIKLDSIGVLLRSAKVAFPLVTIHRETVDREACWIGEVMEVSEDHVSLLEIDPDARWHKRPKKYLLSEITRVDLGGAYENALYLVSKRSNKNHPTRAEAR